MELNSRNAITFIVGILGGAGTVYAVIYLRRRLRKSCTKLTHEQLIDQISLETLRKLSEVPNQSIRQCAFHILKARALKPEFLWILVQLCYAENEKCVLEACAVLESLTKNPECRARIVYVGGLEALSHVIYRSWRNKGEIYVNDCGKIQLLACMAIADLIINNNTSKLQLLDKNPSFLPSILGIMNDTSSRELEKWGLYLIHQITLCEATRDWLCQHWAVIKIVSKLVVKSQGEPLRLKLAFQVLVTLANILMANDEENVLKEIRSFGVIMPMIGCFKSDNHELVYWAVGLLHEFVTFNIALPEICAVPVLLRYLCNVLTFSEATIQRLVLRVLRHLCEWSEDFLTKTMHNKYLLARLPICLSSGDPDVRSWSLYLIHDIAKSGIEGILLLFEHAKGIVEALVEICARNVFNQDANTICRYIAETLGFLCSMETIQCEVVKAGALKAVLQISMMEDIDMKFWSASLLLNLSMCADVLKEEIVKNGAVKILIHLAVSDTDEPQIAIQAAKTLTMLEFLDSPFVIDLKSSSSSCSVLVNGSEHSPNELGINVVVLDPVTLNVEEKESFDTGHFPDAAIKLTEYIQSLPLMSMVFIVVRGEGNFFLTDDTKKALSSVGVSEYEYKTGELWVLCGQKHYGLKSSREIEFKHGHDDVDLTVNIPQGDFVIDQVEVLIIEPLLDVLMSTSPENNISKVSELMLLTLFARQDSHRIVMLEKEDFLEYLAKMICSMASRSLDELRTNSMIIAHCLGAMKTVAGLILSDTAPERCLRRGVLKEVLHLLCFINHTFLNAKDERKDFMKNSELSFLTSASPGFEEKAPFSSVCDSPASPARPVSAQGTEDSLPEDAKSNYDDFEESFMNLTELAVIILYHCNKKLDLPDDSVFTLSSVNVLWCTLLTCKDELRRAIAIPIENVITCEASRRKLLVEYSERQPVWLNEKEKTPELIVSSNRTEVINFNWTFESVHANVAVGRQRHSAGSSKPSGWYYEVQVMTDGIMQVGWRTRKCEYSPEKGIGVGDDVHSCAFDGARLKIWNGPACETVNNDYGEQWVANDIVSCLFSWHGEVSFWLNGVELGVAFSNMNPHLDYYPAVSLAMQQHCRFNFGGDKPFRYDMPEGYIAVNDVLEKKSTLKRPRSKSYTKGSFESIVEEDEESVEDVKNIHFTRMQRYSSSEPSLHGNANNRADSDEGNRRLSTASLNYDNEYPGTPLTPMSHVSFTPSSPFTPVSPLTPITPLTPVTPITPDTPLSLLRSPKSLNATPADSFSAIPSVYFEVEMKKCGRRAKNVGYYCRTSRKNCSCEFHENQKMSFPSEVAKNVNLVSAPSVLGCGLLVPEGVFFTLDGVFNNIIHPLSDTAYEGDCLPYITYPNLKINYGQEEFLMERANAPKQRAASAKLLHSFSCSLLDRWSSEN